ncbi:serine hydrolase domain-containing protein [Microtetraspora fusca]|uniref:serine hydrolase domain-containing protein n=1 Tax=Microtetraspora fusca TaxID=1997 RepID=UPI000834ABF5|nr:serine hydrolase domain-containing protein [Microtetraspora fusca]
MIRAVVLTFSLLTVGLGIPPAPAVAAPVSKDPVRAALDGALARAAAKAGDPGVQAVVMRDGKLIWSANSGKAVKDPSSPVTDSTMFGYASFGKMILSAYALRQVESGVLALDKPISTYVGKDVPGSDAVTLRMLLTHTAGYPDMYDDPKTAPLFAGGAQYDPNRPYTFAMLAPGIRKPVNPGKRYDYSNTGYIILAHVLSRTAGGDGALERDIRLFLTRAGETSELLTAERSPSAFPRFAHGYDYESPGKPIDTFTDFGAKGIPTDLYGLPFGDGLFAGTALGGAKFLDALYAGNRLLRPDTVKKMITSSPQAVAVNDTYGMGTERALVGGRVWQGHPGAFAGFTSMGATDMARGVTLMVVTNRDGSDEDPAGTIWKELAEAYTSVTR